jgi:hypothetical protein
LFRQRQFNDWAGAVDDLRHELIRIGQHSAKTQPNGATDSANAAALSMLHKLSA